MGPMSLLDTLTDIRQKVRRLALVSGAGWVITIAIALLLALVLADWALVLSAGARLLLGLGAIATLAASIRHWLYLPARGVIGLSDLAGRIEQSFPQFDDRLRSTVDFLQQDIPGSRSMKQRVVTQTSEIARSVDLADVIQLRPLWQSVGLAGAALIVMLSLIGFAGRQNLEIALNRLTLGSQEWPKAVQIAVDGEIPERVPVGQRIAIKMRLSRGDRESRQAVIFYRYDNGPWQQELMTRADGAYTAALDARIDQNKTTGQLQVRMEAGDDSHELAPITVVPRLDVAHAEAEIVPPPYVKPRVQNVVNLAERPAVAAMGSDVAIWLRFNKPLAKDLPVELLPSTVARGDGSQKVALPPKIQWDRPSESVAVARFQANQSFRFTVRAVDVDHFANTTGEEFELIAREDQPPTVQIEEPRRSEDRTPEAAFDLRAVAEDDYGIDAAQLVVQRIGDKGAANSQAKNSWVIDLVQNASVSAPGAGWVATDSNPDRKRYRLDYHWDLAKLDTTPLKPGDTLEYFIRVKDNFDLDGKQHDWVSSGKLRVTIISPDQWKKAVDSVIEQVYQSIKAADQGQQRNKAETMALQQGVDQKKKFDDADKHQADRLANQQSGAASQTEQIATKLEQLLGKMSENKSPDDGTQKTVDEVKKQLNQTAEGSMREATRALSEANDHPLDAKASAAQQADDARKRSDALAKSTKSQQTSSDQLKAAMEKLGNFGGLSEALQQFNNIRDKQADLKKRFGEQMKGELGKKPEEMSKTAQDAAKQLAEEQKALAERTQKALDELAKKAEQLSQSDPPTAAAMKQAAQAGQQQQVPGKQSRAAESMQQNQQGQAQAQHQQIELGLDQIITKLKEAERRKLEELQRKLAEFQQQIAELLKRQAGHNIDNLLAQGGVGRLAKVSDAERKILIDLSARDEKSLGAAPAPTSGQQSASQEQTEQNTRDIAHTAEGLADPAPSAKLTEAADQMERAIVHLREGRLAEAYDPPQVASIKALQEAAQIIDEALKNANDQLEEEKQETIKKQYVALLASQKKVGDDVVKIDKTPRNDAGELPREEGVRLGQLPGEQGKLSDAAQQLGEKLATLGGVVYIWANKDIVQSMNDLKEDLAKPKTGLPTQAAEKRIEEQLQAMIDSLATHPKKSEFAKRDGGGGGSGKQPPPKMPTEAELQLLKALQSSINKNTVALNDDKAHDNQKLLELGGRQGEFRNLLDKLVQAASKGQVKLGPEPDNKDQLPEEASKDDVADQEFDKGLLNDNLGADTVEKGMKLTGDRMARSRQRLALNNDPGAVTQEIQKRILKDFDQMIELAQQQQQGDSKPKPGDGKPGDKPGEPKPADGKSQQQANGKSPGQSHQQQGQTAAGQSTSSQGSPPNADLSKELKEKLAEWGAITSRDREAVQEGASEKPLDKYRKFTEDYYKSVSEQAAKR